MKLRLLITASIALLLFIGAEGLGYAKEGTSTSSAHEIILTNPNTNAHEAEQNLENSFKQQRLELQTKLQQGREQRQACITQHKDELRLTEASGSGILRKHMASCSAQFIGKTLPKPTPPSLNGLTQDQKKALYITFRQQMASFSAQLKQSVMECRKSVGLEQVALKQQRLQILQQCSNLERTVLGLSTDIPYNQ